MQLVCSFHNLVQFLKIAHFSAPSASPKGMSWEGSSSTTITIKWGPVPCADCNGNITSYVVMFRENGKEMFHNKTTTGVDMEFTITGLEPSTEYEIKVAAFTVAVGPFTNDSLFASTTGSYMHKSCIRTLQVCVIYRLAPYIINHCTDNH